MSDTNALFAAAAKGDVTALNSIIDAKVNLNRVNKAGNALIHRAAKQGHLAVVKRLVEVGANLGLGDENGQTPLMIAVENEHVDVADALAGAGAPLYPQKEPKKDKAAAEKGCDGDAMSKSGAAAATPATSATTPTSAAAVPASTAAKPKASDASTTAASTEEPPKKAARHADPNAPTAVAVASKLSASAAAEKKVTTPAAATKATTPTPAAKPAPAAATTSSKAKTVAPAAAAAPTSKPTAPASSSAKTTTTKAAAKPAPSSTSTPDDNTMRLQMARMLAHLSMAKSSGARMPTNPDAMFDMMMNAALGIGGDDDDEDDEEYEDYTDEEDNDHYIYHDDYDTDEEDCEDEEEYDDEEVWEKYEDYDEDDSDVNSDDDSQTYASKTARRILAEMAAEKRQKKEAETAASSSAAINWSGFKPTVAASATTASTTTFPNAKAYLEKTHAAATNNNNLHDLAAKGDAKGIKDLLKTAANKKQLTATNSNKHTPIDVAARAGNIEALTALLAGVSNKGPIHAACRNKETDVVKALIAAKCELNFSSTSEGDGPLHIAAAAGDKELVTMLLAAKADVMFKNKNSLRPIDVAAVALNRLSNATTSAITKAKKEGTTKTDSSKAAATVAGNVEMTADLTAIIAQLFKAEGGKHAYRDAIKLRREDIVNGLIAAKCNVNAPDDDKRTALHYAIGLDFLKVVGAIIKAGADLFLRDAHEDTPLDVAAFCDSVPAAKLLVAASADRIKEYKSTPFIVAADNGNIGVLQYLMTVMDKPADSAERSLMAAIENNEINFVRMGIAKGADVNYRNEKGGSCLMLAACRNHPAIIRMLVAAGARINAEHDERLTVLEWAVGKRYMEATRELVKLGADINHCGDRGSALHIACMGLNEEIATFLIKSGADVNCTYQNTLFGGNAFQLVVNFKLWPVAKLMVSKGANCNQPPMGPMPAKANTKWMLVNAIVGDSKPNMTVLEVLVASPTLDCEVADKAGNTALHHAAVGGHTAALKLLLKKGAKLETGDKRGCGALYFACSKANLEIVKLLLEAGANPSPAVAAEFTPLAAAKKKGHDAIVKLIEAASLKALA